MDGGDTAADDRATAAVPRASAALDRSGHWLRTVLRIVIDFALPPRCPACGEMVEGDRQLCLDCWQTVQFMGDDGCAGCSLPLAGAGDVSGDGRMCGACLADPPPFAGAPAAVAYGPVARTVAMRLKYGRRLGHARLMADLMRRHLPPPGDLPQLLVPVPLHRWRLWSRGFNQAGLIATELGRGSGVAVAHDLMLRRCATRSQRGLNRRERAAAVRGAFALSDDARARLAGWHVVLIDDVHASGATVRAAARLLQRGGAGRVSVLTFARVVPDAMATPQFDFATLDSDI